LGGDEQIENGLKVDGVGGDGNTWILGKVSLKYKK